jgi:mono/diheme cytochrome c family protein
MGEQMKAFVAGVATCVVLAVIVAVGVSYSGLPDIAAASPDNPVVAWLLHNTYSHARDRAAAAVAVPANLETTEAVKAGAKIYANECVYCHGAPGEEETGMAKGLNPSPPPLLSYRQGVPPARAFWVMKYGVRMTAMPAWGKSYDDGQIWSVAAFLHAKHGLSAEDYKALTAD